MMIGRWIDAQDDEVLGRLASVDPEHWSRHDGWRFAGEATGCLHCHAFDCRSPDDYRNVPREHWDAETRYMRLSNRFGDSRIGHMISERASRILRERRKVPVSVHVSLNCEPVEVGA